MTFIWLYPTEIHKPVVLKTHGQVFELNQEVYHYITPTNPMDHFWAKDILQHGYIMEYQGDARVFFEDARQFFRTKNIDIYVHFGHYNNTAGHSAPIVFVGFLARVNEKDADKAILDYLKTRYKITKGIRVAANGHCVPWEIDIREANLL